MRKTLNEENIIELLTFKKRIDNGVNETSSSIFQKENRFDINIIHWFMILNIMNKIIIVGLA